MFRIQSTLQVYIEKDLHQNHALDSINSIFRQITWKNWSPETVVRNYTTLLPDLTVL